MSCLNQDKTYKVHTALWEDINEGRVWVSTNNNDKEWAEKVLKGQRYVVCIKNLKSKIYCEALYADDWYFEHWDRALASQITAQGTPRKEIRTKDRIYMNGWYHQLLKIKENEPESENLTIEFAKSRPKQVMWQIMACLQHPQIVVFLSTMLGIISVGLGIISLCFGLKDITPNIVFVINIKYLLIITIMGFGAFFIGYGVRQFFKRATCAPLH
jgi:hypothetical protein